MRHPIWPLGFALFLLSACVTGPKSPVGFRLPEGDVGRGKRVFVELECNSCHQVAGIELPAPKFKAPVPVVLGGKVFEIRTDGYLVTSIINPSHELASGYRTVVVATADGESRMRNYENVMTIRQLVDLVAFLQSTYQLTIPPPPGL